MRSHVYRDRENSITSNPPLSKRLCDWNHIIWEDLSESLYWGITASMLWICLVTYALLALAHWAVWLLLAVGCWLGRVGSPFRVLIWNIAFRYIEGLVRLPISLDLHFMSMTMDYTASYMLPVIFPFLPSIPETSRLHSPTCSIVYTDSIVKSSAVWRVLPNGAYPSYTWIMESISILWILLKQSDHQIWCSYERPWDCGVGCWYVAMELPMVRQVVGLSTR